MLNFNRSLKWKGLAMLMAMTALLFTASCSFKRELHIAGKTMGTTYHITVVAGWFTSAAGLKKKIDKRLVAINKSMSAFDPHSELSRFNAIKSTTERFVPSADFLYVLKVSARIYQLTDGAWDGTLNPLIDLWGFGHTGTFDRVPPEAEIRQALTHVGFNRIHLDPKGFLVKKDPDVTLDLASDAKGYGVDAISRLLDDSGYFNFLVEIGGEVYARGHRQDGKPWRVGINRPNRKGSFSAVYKTVDLTDLAMATSGDYRNYFQVGNHFYSHILDPRTGRPVTDGVVSASVVAENCTVADALATALMVMGPQKGVALVNRLPSVECLMVVRKPDGTLVNYPSKGFMNH